MRRLLYLFLPLLVLFGCETSEIEEFCPETDYSGRNSSYDTLFYGTWQWHYSVLTCNEAGSHGSSTEIIRDTIWPDEHVPWLNGPYPKQTIIVDETDNLRLVVDSDTAKFCVVKWVSYGETISFGVRTYIGITYRLLNSNELHHIGLENNTWAGMGDSICRVEPVVQYHDICPSEYPGFYYPSMTDYYIKVK
jgi:hypothetical protein